ncbi:MAG: hypothetical protein CL532_00825 [Aestuariivita sp.]|nr:hypothetical protein [Aestuariivita sp.]
MKKTSKDTDTNSEKVKGASKKACGGDCVSPTICKDIFQGDCAVEVMSQKLSKGEKPGTADSAPKGKY